MSVQARIVKQSNLTSECWPVQVWGLDACKKCEYRGKRDCGGKQIRKSAKNTKGINVPV